MGDLRYSPERGSVVEEISDPFIREIGYRDQRILYRYDGVWVVILMVFHGSHVPDFSKLFGD